MNPRICLVEDDPTIRELVALKLKSVGYSIEAFEDAEAVLKRDLTDWDFFILDVMLPGEASGRDLCKAIRAENISTPILFLSALSEPADRIEGLKEGADDYLSKPFEMEELILRISGMLKRRSWYELLPLNGSSFSWAGNSIDFLSLEAKANGKRINLTQKECMVMKLLIEKENQVVSRDEILDQVWGYHSFPSSRTVDNFILRLRRYFDNPGEPEFIESVRGMGYKFNRKGSRA